MSRTEITNEQITAGATVLTGYKNLRLNWRNAAIDVFDAMTAAAPASADNPSTAGAAHPIYQTGIRGGWQDIEKWQFDLYNEHNDGSIATRIVYSAAPVAQSTTSAAKDLPLLAALALQEAGEIAQKALAPKLSGSGLRNQFKRIINVARAGIADIERLAAPAPHAQPEPAAQALPPSNADEIVAFIGNYYYSMVDATEDPADIEYLLSVRDLLSAFRWWFEDGFDLESSARASAHSESGGDDA